MPSASSDHSPLPGWTAAGGRWLGRASVWLIRRPFLARRWVWATSAALLVVLGTGALVVGHMLLGVVVALAAMVPIATLVHWRWLARGRRPIVIVTVFKARSAAGKDVADSHTGALKLFLEADEYLQRAGPITVRTLALPVSESSATRLLQLAGVLMVVRGTGDAGMGTSRWEGSVHFDAEAPAVTLNQHALTTYTDRPAPTLGRGRGVPAVTAAARFEEGELAVSEFFGTTISVKHFRQVSKIGCLLLAEKQWDGDHVPESGIAIVPRPEDADLDPELQARSFRLQAAARIATEDPRAILEDIEQRALRDGLGGPELALWIVGQWFSGEVEEWSTIGDTRAAIDRWVEIYPDHPLLAMNSAGVAIREGDLDRARAEIRRGEQLDTPVAALERLRGNIAWSEDRPADALEHYQRASIDRGVLRWQMGDCFAALGKRSTALREYRAALRMDSFRVPAAEHARIVGGWGALLPTYPPGWRRLMWWMIHRAPRVARPTLRAWRRMRPEDPYLATYLARHALVLGDIRRADDWGTYATRFAGTNRLIAQLDQVVVLSLLRDPQAQAMTEFLRSHTDWLAASGLHAPADEVARAFRLLVHSSRAIRRQPEIVVATDLLARAGIVGTDVLT